MGENVITPDFGKDRNEAVRRFARLFGIAEELEKDVLANPMKHLVAASGRMAQLAGAVRAAQDLLRVKVEMVAIMRTSTPPIPFDLDVVNVPRAHYERLKAAGKALQEIDV